MFEDNDWNTERLDQFHQEVKIDHNVIEAMQTTMETNTKAIDELIKGQKRIEHHTEGIVEAGKAIAGFVKVITVIGRFCATLTAIAAAIAAAIYWPE